MSATLKINYDRFGQNIKVQRLHAENKGIYCQNHAFSNCESWAIRKAQWRKSHAFELWCWRKLLKKIWTSERTNNSVLDKVKPDILLQVLIIKLNLGQIILRQNSLERCLVLEKVGGNIKKRQVRTTTEVKLDRSYHWWHKQALVITQTQSWQNVHWVTKSQKQLNNWMATTT